MNYVLTEVQVVKLPHYVENPANLTYATPLAACFDICAALDEPLSLRPGDRFAVPTGVRFAPQAPLWFRINSRSGLAAKNGIITLAGIIDSDYRGEIKIVLLNTNPSGEAYIIRPGDKIAQVELPFPYRAVFKEVSADAFDESGLRGSGGFGSTGR